MSENRKATRLSWSKEAILVLGDTSFECRIAEVSMKNAVLIFKENFQFNVGESGL